MQIRAACVHDYCLSPLEGNTRTKLSIAVARGPKESYIGNLTFSVFLQYFHNDHILSGKRIYILKFMYIDFVKSKLDVHKRSFKVFLLVLGNIITGNSSYQKIEPQINEVYF